MTLLPLALLAACAGSGDRTPAVLASDEPAPGADADLPAEAGDSAGPPGADLPGLRAPGDWPCARAADVVVVGGGPAGLAVASRLETGLLVEADDELGGRIRLTPAPAGVFVDAPGQDDERDTLDAALDDWEALTGEPPTEATERWLAATPEVYDHLLSLGIVPEEAAADVATGVSNHTMALGVSGEELADALASEIPAGVELCAGQTVDGVLVRDGAVTGIVAGDAVVAARAVVVATGGFAASRGWVADITGWPDDGSWGVSTDDAVGVALDWAAAGGWGTARLDAVGWFSNAIGIAGTTSSPMLVDYGTPVPWIWVDGEGRRFADEGDPFSLAPAHLLLERDPVWAISRRDDLEERVLSDDLAALEAAIEAGEDVVCAGDPDTLADLLGLDPDAFADTLAQVDAVRTGAEADPYGRKRESVPTLDGELCAWPPGLVAAKTFGGLDVDAEGRVRDADGAVIAGLYAAGEAAGMGVPGMGGAHGFDGSITAVLWSGWRTGEAVMADLAR